MKITTQDVFHCDFCKKKQFRKGDMTKHEKWCKYNPNNQHACFNFCENLIRSEEHYDGIYYESKKTVFTCNISKKEMYSYNPFS